MPYPTDTISSYCTEAEARAAEKAGVDVKATAYSPLTIAVNLFGSASPDAFPSIYR